MLALGELKSSLAQGEVVLLSAPPGTGKTTTIPTALLDEPWLAGKRILVLEPRRLAARRAAMYIAQQRNEPVGRTIGYQVRLEKCSSAATRIEFLTEGLLSRRMIQDPELQNVGLIIFDEFHERSLAADIAFALAREIRGALRPDLRLLIMSATLDRKLLPEAHWIEIPAKSYPVDVKYLGACSPTSAILRALREEEGSILCFLPGEGEIKRCAEALTANALPSNVHVCPLYAALDTRLQDEAVAPPAQGQRKIVLATSIAESSITIEGIRVVIDSGLARVPKFMPRNGLTRLVTQPVPNDRATQRTGRAGRLMPGVCYRLWEENLPRPAFVQPEILDTDLTQTALLCAAWGSYSLDWVTPPPPSAWQRAQTQLRALGVTNEDGALTELGREVAQFPLEPALATLILRLCDKDPFGGALLAAVCSEGERSAKFRSMLDFRRVLEDVIAERPYNIWQLAQRWCPTRDTAPRLPVDALVGYLLYAFPEHIARRRAGDEPGHYLTAAGFGVTLPLDCNFINAQWILAIRMSDADAEARIHWAVPLEQSDLDHCTPTTRLRIEWDKRACKLIAAEETRLGAIVLKQRPLQNIPPEAAAYARRCKLKALGLPWDAASRSLAARIAYLGKKLPDEGWPTMDEAQLIEQLADVLEYQSLHDAIVGLLRPAHHSLQEINELLPQTYRVPSGSAIKIDYSGEQPAIGVKLQELFGLSVTPTLLRGRQPLLIKLLSPAGRPVQITQDLVSFWQNGYPIVRKELRGRYPKHPWPEDPTQAIATRYTQKKFDALNAKS